MRTLPVRRAAAASAHANRRQTLAAGGALLLAAQQHQPAQAAEQRTAADIYAQYQYQSPKDVVAYVRDEAPQGDPAAVLQAIDSFSAAYPMYKIGPEKGVILDELVELVQPQLVVELGSFVGYSAVRISRLLRPGAQLICVEANPECVEAMEGVLRHAGLRDRVVIVQALAGEAIPTLAAQYGQASLLFEDHAKACYLPDLEACCRTGLVGPGSWTIADNVLYPGAPDLLAHLAGSGQYHAMLAPAAYEYEQAWNPSWEAGKQDAMSLAVRTAGLSGSQASQARQQLMQLCDRLPTACVPVPYTPVSTAQTPTTA